MSASGSFSVRTSLLSPGAISLLDIWGDAASVFSILNMAPVEVGSVALRRLVGTDTGIVVLWNEYWLSVMPHGSPAIVEQIRSALFTLGFSEFAEPDAARAYPEARSSVEALALRALTRALSPRALEVLLPQHDAHMLGKPPAPGHVNRAVRRLIDPPLVVAFGPPNIGKSTLCNALAGASVAIVADEPGTTRDPVGVLINLDGVVVRWVDAPGICAGARGPDLEVQNLALALAQTADLLIRVCDPRQPPLSAVPDVPALDVCLRADLGPERWNAEADVSVARGVGLSRLAEVIRRRLVPDRALDPCWAVQFWGDADLSGVS